MKMPTPEQIQEFKDHNPNLKVKITPQGVRIAPRRRQASLDVAPPDIKQRTLRANAFMALRNGLATAQRREAAEAAKKAAEVQAQALPIAPIDETAITAAVTEHAAQLAVATGTDPQSAKDAIESVSQS